MHAVEVVARFDTTVLDTVLLDRDASYRVGTEPGVDLAVPLSGNLAIVERDLVRVPPAATATLFEAGREQPLIGEVRLGAKMRVELRIGRVVITLRRTARPAAVPRPRIDRRRHAYDAVSLALHLVLLVVAVELAPFHAPSPAPSRPVRVARIPETRPPSLEAPTPVPAIATAPADPTEAPPPAEKAADLKKSRRSAAIARAREAGILASEGLSDLRALTPSDPAKAFKGVRPVYREEEAVARQFGGGDSWDPGGIVKMGRFQTRSNAGADYELAGATPAVKTVLDVSGAITGALSREKVIEVVRAHAEDLLDCHERKAGKNARGTVSLAFDIDRDGTVLRPTADGMGTLAGCALRVVEKIGFPTAPGDLQTEVTLSLEFR